MQHFSTTASLCLTVLFCIGCTPPNSNDTPPLECPDSATHPQNSEEEAVAVAFPQNFDPIGPGVMALETQEGRTIRYIDQGEADWTPVVFAGGNGTSVRVFALLEFLRSMRESLKLRFISIQRNGFGDSEFNALEDYSHFATDVEILLTHLRVDKFAVVAVSGGGPYINELVARAPERVTTVHMAAAYSHPLDGESGAMDLICNIPPEHRGEFSESFSHNPKEWFAFPAQSSIHQIPGFQAQAFDDAARTFFMGGQMGATEALVHEFELYCTKDLATIDLNSFGGEVFIYAGTNDSTVSINHVHEWESQFGTAVVRQRIYEGEGHDVQYRHWDQILLDIGGMGSTTLLCADGKEALFTDTEALSALESGAGMGLCAWQR